MLSLPEDKDFQQRQMQIDLAVNDYILPFARYLTSPNKRTLKMSMTVGTNSTMLKIISSLSQLEKSSEATMTRLATGYTVNKASDDPSALVAMSGIQSDLVAINAALESNQRSQSILDTADATLQEVGKLTAEIERLATAAADTNITESERAAYQASIDQMLDSIDSLIQQGEFAGTKLFTGATDGTSGNAIVATQTTGSSFSDIKAYSVEPNLTADKVLAVNATNINAVTVDGNAATAEIIKKADGTDSNFARVNYVKDGYNLSFIVNTTTAGATDKITIKAGGGMKFQLGTDSTTRAQLDLGAGVTTAELGGGVLNAAETGLAGHLSDLRSGGTNSLSATNTKALEIARSANAEVALANARVGSFNKFQVGSAVASLEAAYSGMTETYDAIAKTDYTTESQELERQNILMNAAVSMLSMASQKQANVLALLPI